MTYGSESKSAVRYITAPQQTCCLILSCTTPKYLSNCGVAWSRQYIYARLQTTQNTLFRLSSFVAIPALCPLAVFGLSVITSNVGASCSVPLAAFGLSKLLGIIHVGDWVQVTFAWITSSRWRSLLCHRDVDVLSYSLRLRSQPSKVSKKLRRWA